MINIQVGGTDMYICERCGKIHEELPLGEEYYDGGFGTTVADCYCGGDIVEATECDECGEVFKKKGEQCMCDKCLEKYKTFDNAIKIGAEWRYKVTINSFLAECFSVEQIEEILERELREASKLGKNLNKEIEDFIDNEYLSKGVKKGKYEL